ncbi:gliding motility lipoprotein GldH [Hydrotalea sp.]|uniref:gliding motility lipoprotein GldH n=1 Tax=Hydrotalea sp. TaxID=2881279 RepID=UPI0026336DE8|nr:gliding motility lipoprotein GldH [Hydrotalea sp.]
MKRRYFFMLMVVLVMAACTTLNVFEKTIPFPNHTWSSIDTPSFQFNITDTNAFYNLYVVFRHEDAYRYKNIWLNITVHDPDSTYSFNREFTLANSMGWLGIAMDDIIDHRMAFNTLPAKLKKGQYTFTLQQLMREDPLQHVLNAGLRIEKVTP